MTLRVRQLVFGVLAISLAYSGVATVGLYDKAFQAPRVRGVSGSIDGHLAVLGDVSAEEMRAAVRGAGWPPDADVSFVSGPSAGLSPHEVTHARYSLGYLLYPRRIWAGSAADATHSVSGGGERYVIELADESAFSDTRARSVTRSLRLVTLP